MDDEFWDELEDEKKIELDEDRLLNELRDEFMNGDVDDAYRRSEELGVDIDQLLG